MAPFKACLPRLILWLTSVTKFCGGQSSHQPDPILMQILLHHPHIHCLVNTSHMHHLQKADKGPLTQLLSRQLPMHYVTVILHYTTLHRMTCRHANNAKMIPRDHSAQLAA
jgi:hypothetical protein